MAKRTFWAVIMTILLTCGGVSQALAQQSRLSIATAGTGGVFYAYGGAIASVVSKYVPELNITAESTGGSVENLKLIDKKQVDIATTSADVVYQAYYDFANSKHFKNKVELKALFNMYSQPHHIVSMAKGNVKQLQNIKGKRVVVGSPGSGTEVKTKMVLQSVGIEYKDFTPEFLSFNEGAEALQDQTVSAVFLGVAYPSPAVVSLAFTHPIRLISLSDSEIEKIVKTYPFLSKTIIPAQTYKGVDQDTQTVAVQTLVVCRADLPDDVAYKIVQTVFEHKDELNLIHSAFKETTLDNATPTAVPLHPGAIKYFKEKNAYKE